MSLKRTLFFAVILASIALYIFKIEMPKQEESRKGEIWLRDSKIDQISSLKIKRALGEIVFTNSNPVKNSDSNSEQNLSSWQISTIPEAKLDDGSVNSLLSAVTRLKLESPLPKEDVEADLSVYGLKDPEVTITAVINGKDSALYLGKKSEYTNKRYIKTSDSDSIYLISDGIYEASTKPIDDYRDRTPISFDQTEISGLSFETNEQKTTLNIRGLDDWQIIEPIKARADSAVVTETFRNLRALNAKEFFDGIKEEDYKKFNLNKPDSKITISFKEDTKKAPVEILISVAKGGEPKMYFTIKGKTTVYSVDGNTITNFIKTPTLLREKKIAKIEPESVSKIAVTLKGAPEFTLELKKEQVQKEFDQSSWLIDGKEAESAFARDLVRGLTTLEADDFASTEDKPVFEPFHSRYVINVGDTQKTLLVSNEISRKNLKYHYVKFSDIDEIFMISPERLKRIELNRDIFEKEKNDKKDLKIEEVQPQ